MTAVAVKPGVPTADVDFVGPIGARQWTDRSCGRCAMTDCVTVGTVSWETGSEYSSGTDWIEVGRDCVAPAVAEAQEEHGGQITVTLPTWSGFRLAELAGITQRQMNHWTSRGYLVCEEEAHPGSGYERLYLADQIDRAAHMGWLVRVGWSPAGAAALLNHEAGRDVAESVLDTMAPQWRAERAEHKEIA